MIADVLTSIIIIAVIGVAIYSIYREKKKGNSCIGCPMAGDCSKAKTDTCKQLKNK